MIQSPRVKHLGNPLLLKRCVIMVIGWSEPTHSPAALASAWLFPPATWL